MTRCFTEYTRVASTLTTTSYIDALNKLCTHVILVIL